MLLKELSQPRHSVKKLNETLRKSYGRRVPTDIDIDRLNSLLEQVNTELHRFVVEGVSPQDPEYARRLVIKHTAEKLLEQRQKIQEASLADGVLDRVCSKLISCACDCINDGDDYEHALHKVMDIYRSSKYRFPDSEVENRVRHGVDHAFGLGTAYDYDRDTLFDERDVDEGSKFGWELEKARQQGKDTFTVNGKVYPVESPELGEAKKKPKKRENPCWPDYEMVGTKMKGGKEVPNCVPESAEKINEDAPPGMEDWILDNKEEFKKRYGSRWEEVLYATAWKIHNEENGDK